MFTYLKKSHGGKKRWIGVIGGKKKNDKFWEQLTFYFGSISEKAGKVKTRR